MSPTERTSASGRGAAETKPGFAGQAYEFVRELQVGGRTIVWRARRRADGRMVIVKLLPAAAVTPEGRARLRHEFDLLTEAAVPGVVTAYSFEEQPEGLLVSTEDIGGESVDRQIGDQGLDLGPFLGLAEWLARTVARLHERGIIHKDISPAHIIRNVETGELRLTGFAIADRLPQRTVALQPAASLEGTLAYLSPEQTGRVSRPVDYRSDFYCLGATLYHLLTGRPPFVGEDALALVHSHIAQLPVPPHALDPCIPVPVSRIVMKLLAKVAEDRYQSGPGLHHDVERCRHEWIERGEIDDFEPGEADLTDRLHLPQQLFGRGPEIATLLGGVERAAAGGRELLLVAGYSGVGKTSLVHQALQQMLETSGSFAQQGPGFLEGRFDPLRRGLPYSGWSQALAGFVRYILMEPGPDLARWKQDILAAVGRSGRVLTEVIPDLELVIGPQPRVLELGGAEALHRFRYLTLRLVKAIATAAGPLVVFLDDLQWIDEASLSLLDALLTSDDVNHLLIIGTYRENEVGPGDPLTTAVDALVAAGVPVRRISLPPLSEQSIGQWLAQGLGCPPETCRPLSHVVHAKTGGNPFFTLHLVKDLEGDGLLRLDRRQRRWVWDRSAIAGHPVTDNVVDLMVRRLRQLPSQTRQLLQRAACVGNRFTLAMLDVIADEPPGTARRGLSSALEEGLLIPAGSAYQFVHDRVLQAAAALASDDERRALHWRVGLRLLQEGDCEDALCAEARPRLEAERLFEVVSHLNLGVRSFASSAQMIEVARLNRRAGRTAKAQGAFATALAYFEAGASLLEEASWVEHYSLALGLHQDAADAACLSGQYARMRELAAVVHRRAACLPDEVQVYCTEIRALVSQGELHRALRRGLEVLEKLGMPLPEEPSDDEIREHLERTRRLIEESGVDGLHALPAMASPEQQARATVLAELGEAAYVAAPRLCPVWAAVFAELSLRHGNCATSPYAYLVYTLFLCATGDHLELGSRLAQTAIALLEPLGAQSMRSQMLRLYGAMVQFRTEHLAKGMASLQEAIDVAPEHGELVAGGHAAYNLCIIAFFRGEPLDDLLERLRTNLSIAVDMRQILIWKGLAFILLVTQRLRGSNDRPPQLATFDEEAWVAEARAAQNYTEPAYYFLLRLIEVQLLGETTPGQALALVAGMRQTRDSLQGTFAIPVLHLYESLVLLRYGLGRGQDPVILTEVRENRDQLAAMAQSAPMNFRHKCDLIDAELARSEGRGWEAAQLYEQAIAGAQASGYVQEQALACERAATFYLDQGLEHAGGLYLRAAYEGYRQWQAHAKVRALQRDCPRHLPSIMGAVPDLRPETFDVETVIKATRVISGEMELDRLLDTVLGIAIENAGAQRGFLLLQTDGTWSVAATRQAGDARPPAGPDAGERAGADEASGLDEQDLVSIGVVRLVARSRQRVVLDDAAKEGAFVHDPHVQRARTRSLFVAPLLSRGELVGIAYLENDLTAGAFIPERVELLETILAQAAVSLENAKVYQKLRESEAELEQRVARRTAQLHAANAELQTTNAELEAFTYCASHDLRAPLRALRGFSEILLADHADALDDEARRYAQKIEGAAQRMGELLDELLRLSQMSRVEMHLRQVDLSAQVTAAVEDLQRREPQRRSRFLITHGVKATADPYLIGTVLENLLGNAWKFTSRQAETVIEFGTLRIPDAEVCCFVRDNGAGFDPAHAQRLFQPFQRLHTAEEFPGSGIGLASVRRIVERHDGRTWAEGHPGRGATVYFTLNSGVARRSFRRRRPDLLPTRRTPGR